MAVFAQSESSRMIRHSSAFVAAAAGPSAFAKASADKSDIALRINSRQRVWCGREGFTEACDRMTGLGVSVIGFGVTKPSFIELSRKDRLPILYEDRSVLAIDKPPGWMLVPFSWQKTGRNLQAAIVSSIAAGHFWARSRNLKFLRHVHRLDAETSGVLLFAKSLGALDSLGALFETRRMEKVYLAVTREAPKNETWTCRLSLAPDPSQIGRMIADRKGKEAETAFRVITRAEGAWLIEARPLTGRTHQIRVHLAESGCTIVGDELYGRAERGPMGLRAVSLGYQDPVTRRRVVITAPEGEFLVRHGFDPGVK
jgi:23S rRNA pseudouridine1911/1915/1917 synthase